MTKTVSPALDAHLEQSVTTLARCWKIVRVDGTVFRFTSHDVDLPVPGDGTYQSASGFQSTAIQNKSDLTVDNLDIIGIFDDDAITIEDLRAGLFDYADVYIFLVNWDDLSQGPLKMRRGKLGECSASPQGWFQVELRGLNQLLQQTIVDLFGPECRVDLGSVKCGVDLTALTSTAHVASVPDPTHVVVVLDTTAGDVTSDDWFRLGTVKFTSGLNDGKALEVKSWSHTTNTFEFYVPPGYALQAGVTLSLTPGCNKSRDACKNKFHNLVNMRAEPDLPGNDSAFTYPDSQA